MSEDNKHLEKRAFLTPKDEEAIRKIGGKLREKYDEVASEPIPDKFTDLLNQLANSSAEQKDGDA